MSTKVENSTSVQHDAKLPVSRQFTCDCCEETWEENFMCEKCSGLQEIETRDNDGFEDTELALMSICENCCRCNLY